MVGDGITDWEIKKLGDQVTFFAYTENVSRKNVVDKADFEAIISMRLSSTLKSI